MDVVVDALSDHPEFVPVPAGWHWTGVVSIHGSLATTEPAQPGTVKAKVLVCHGALDPHVPLTDVTRFAEETNHAQADWQLTMYGGAMHPRARAPRRHAGSRLRCGR
jgi:dienelactone hydrolase